ncbi:MAG: hypothetical protein E7390_02930 [Ruminococcaceae bacterium]|nr:hypothetical protein [Oscillospiraceae bacterium]
MTKKIWAMILSIVMCLTMSYTATFAVEEIPVGLPEGAVKIAEGIYAYTPSFATCNYIDWTNIGNVSAFGTIDQPPAFANVTVNKNHNWLCIQCTDAIRVNFVGGTHSVFGANCMNWVSVGGNASTIYYIDADTYSITRGLGYQLQCTSVSATVATNVEIKIWSES